ncbi:DUF3618 domain-containing protein [Streptomyces sp. NPDC002580]|uniref:DUF3618 domain-containing protein n=1 Tax=Streptomyces sp. NPDC002580 TaxID=3364653 RepID=UPI0036CC5C77
MTNTPADRRTPSPDELREQIEQTRHDLGETVQALADKTDVKARARQRAGELKRQATVKAGELRVHGAKAVSQVQDKVPGPVKVKASRTAGQVRAAAAQTERVWEAKAPAPLRHRTARTARVARDHRALLLVAAAGITVLWLARRSTKA